MPTRRDSTYAKITEDLRSRIGGGEFQDGRLPPERELAAAYGVNRLTLRKALRELFEDGLVVKLGQRGTFVASGDSIKERFSGRSVGAVITGGDIHNMFYGTILSTLKRQLEWYGMELSAHLVDTPDQIESLRRRNMARHELCGMIHAGFTTPETLRTVLAFRVPSVLIGSPSEPCAASAPYDSVVHNYEKYVFDGTNLLLEHGFSRICFIGGPPRLESRRMAEAHRRALEAKGAPFAPELLFTARSESIAAGMELGNGPLKDVPFDCLFICHEGIARGIIDALASRDVKIPGDMPTLIVGHPADNVVHLGLPRYEFDPAGMAEAAVKLLVRRMAAPGVETKTELMDLRLMNADNLPYKRLTPGS